MCDKEKKVQKVCGLSNWNNGADNSEIAENVERSALVEMRKDQKFSFGYVKSEMLIRHLSGHGK